MKIGVRAHDYDKMPIAELIKRIKKDGFETIQLAIPKVIEEVKGFNDITPELVEDIKEICEEVGMEIGVFGCYIEPALLDDGKRQEEVAKFLKSIEFAKQLNAKCIGTETTRFDRAESEREEAFMKLVDSVRSMVAKAEEVGIDVGIEPVASHTLNTPQLTGRLIEMIDSPRLKIIFDPVNLITAENIKNQEKLWDDCFELFGDKICAMHIKGIKLGEDNKLQKVGLNEAEINYTRLIKEVQKGKEKLPLLREEAVPAMAQNDQEFIKTRI